MKVYSKVKPELLLHEIHRKCDFSVNRVDISDESQGLQVAALPVPRGKTFRPHIHVPRPRNIEVTQETWILIEGSILVTYYDIDGTLLSNEVLFAGDCTITYFGGHTYEGLNDSLVYEVKTGPFDPQAVDKEFLDVL